LEDVILVVLVLVVLFVLCVHCVWEVIVEEEEVVCVGGDCVVGYEVSLWEGGEDEWVLWW